MYKGLSVAVLITGVMLFSGCAGKSLNGINVIKDETPVRYVETSSGSSLTSAGAINSSNRLLLQAAAEETIASGFTSFKFQLPGGFIISEKTPKHINQKDIISAKDFIEKCSNSSELASFAIKGLTPLLLSNYVDSKVNNDPCLFYYKDGAFSSGWINMSNDKNAINAQEVINDLKNFGFYNTFPKEYNNPDRLEVLNKIYSGTPILHRYEWANTKEMKDQTKINMDKVEAKFGFKMEIGYED